MQSTTIDATRLGDEPFELRLQLDSGWITRELDGVVHAESAAEAEATLSVTRVGSNVQITGQLSAHFSVPCSRCLEPAQIDHDESFYMVYEAQENVRALPEELELTAEDLHWEVFDGREIDLAPLLRERLILCVPMAPLCAPDCPGLEQPDVGAYENEVVPDEKPMDPRWNALAKLKRPR